MIRECCLDDVDEALGLIRKLARPGQRAWCLADLIHHWDLGPDEIERILATAPTQAARRRLRTRAMVARG